MQNTIKLSIINRGSNIIVISYRVIISWLFLHHYIPYESLSECKFEPYGYIMLDLVSSLNSLIFGMLFVANSEKTLSLLGFMKSY